MKYIMFDQCSRKIYKFIGFYTLEEMNDLSILWGGGGGRVTKLFLIHLMGP